MNITEQFTLELMNYLATKPYQEVYKFLQVLQVAIASSSKQPTEPPVDVPVTSGN